MNHALIPCGDFYLRRVGVHFDLLQYLRGEKLMQIICEVYM